MAENKGRSLEGVTGRAHFVVSVCLLASVLAACNGSEMGGKARNNDGGEDEVAETQLTAEPPSLLNVRTARFEFTGSPEGGSFECHLDEDAWQPCVSPSQYDTLSDGQHTFNVRYILNAVPDATPSSASFEVVIASSLPPPDTMITAGPAQSSTQTTGDATFSFSSTGADDTFDCQLDQAVFSSCVSPKVYTQLANGAHVFRVRAKNAEGNPDATPSVREWTVKVPDFSGVALGVLAGQDGGDGGAWEATTMTAVHSFEQLTKSKPKLVHMFYPMYNNSSCAVLPPGPSTALREGYTPMLSWSFLNYGGSNAGFDYAGILAGNFDACVRSFAKQAKALSGPLILRMFWEMNGGWFNWGIRVGTNTPQRHIDAFRRIVNLFREEGATNVKFAWCPNNRFGEADAFASYYPADAYVDYLCLDDYNWGAATGQAWKSFDGLYSASYTEITALSLKPLMIGEYASHTGPGDKAAWINAMRTSVKSAKFRRIKILTWFNKNQDGATWQVDSSTASLNAYKLFAADSYFLSDVP